MFLYLKHLKNFHLISNLAYVLKFVKKAVDIQTTTIYKKNIYI